MSQLLWFMHLFSIALCNFDLLLEKKIWFLSSSCWPHRYQFAEEISWRVICIPFDTNKRHPFLMGMTAVLVDLRRRNRNFLDFQNGKKKQKTKQLLLKVLLCWGSLVRVIFDGADVFVHPSPWGVLPSLLSLQICKHLNELTIDSWPTINIWILESLEKKIPWELWRGA